jgi:hypothetical protein
VQRHVEAKCFRGLEVEDEFELHRLLDREIGGFLAFEDAAGVDAGLVKEVSNIGAVAHQTAGRSGLAPWKDCGHGVAKCQCAELLSAAIEEYVGGDRQRPGAQLNRARKDRVEFALGARMEDMQLKPKSGRSNLRLSRYRFGLRGIGRIDDERNGAGVGYQFVKQLQQFRHQLHVQRSDAGNIATRSVEAGNEADFHGVITGREDDRGCGGYRFGRERRWRAECSYHGDLPTNHINGLEILLLPQEIMRQSVGP